MSWTWESIVVRAVIVLGLAGASYHLRPFQLSSSMAMALGVVLGVACRHCSGSEAGKGQP